jgi:hypothetical protein
MPKRKRTRITVEEVDEGQPFASDAAAPAEIDTSSAEEDNGSDTEIPPQGADEASSEEGSGGEDDSEEGDYSSGSDADGADNDDDDDGQWDSGDDGEEPVDSEEEAEREKQDADSIGITEMDIQFFDPTEPDFHAVKLLLQNYLDTAVWSISSLVELVLAQTRVGTTVRVNDEEDGSGSRDPCGFISALNIRQHRKQECIQQIVKHVLKKCPKDGKVRAVFEKALKLEAPGGPKASLAQATGLLLSERYFNLPAQMAPWLNKGLLDEVTWAVEDEKKQEDRDAFKFKQYLILTKVQRGAVDGSIDDDDDDGAGEGKKQKKAKMKKKKGGKVSHRSVYLSLHASCV